MKKLTLLLISVLLSSIMYAKKDDKHLLNMVQCINDSDFVCAQNELPKIKNWQNTTLALYFGKAINFYYDILNDASNPALQNEKIRLDLARFIATEAKDFADYCNDEDKYETAIQYGEISLDFYKYAKMLKTVEYALALGDIGVYYDNMEDDENSASYYLLSINLYEELGAVRNMEYAAYLSYLGDIYSKNGNYQEAHSLLSKSITTLTSLKKQKTTDYIYAIRALANLYFKEGNNESAEQYFKEAQEKAKSVVGEENIIYLNILRDMVTYYKSIGDERKWQQTQQDVVLCAMSVFGPSSAACGKEWKNLAIVMYEKKILEYAEKDFKKAADIIKGDIGELNTSYIECVIYLGQLALDQGNEKEAEQYFMQAKDLVGRTEGANSVSYAQCLNIISRYYWETGDYNNASILVNNAVRIYEESGEYSEDYATALNGLGKYYIHTRNYKEALSVFLKSCDIYEKNNLTQNDEYAYTLQNISSIYEMLDEPGLSQEYAQRASRIEQKHIESLDNDIQSFERMLQGYYTVVALSDGSDDELSASMKNGIETWIYSEVLLLGLHHGIMSNESVNALIKLSNVCLQYGEYSAGLSLSERCSAILRNRMSSTIDFMTEKQRQSFWDLHSDVFYEHIPKVSYYAYSVKKDAASFAYDNELFLKGMLLRSSDAIKQSILNSGDTALIARWEQLSTLKKEIVSLQERSPQSELLRQFTQQANDLEKQITKASAEYRNSVVLEGITSDSIRRVLRPNQVAVEYMSVPMASDTTIYCALLLRDTCTYPIMIPLFQFSEDLTQLLLAAVGEESIINDIYANQELGILLSNLIWRNVKPYLNIHDTVYFSPTGLLHQLAIEALPYDETHTMADVYNLVRLSSTREIVLGKSSDRHATATLYGGLRYNMNGDNMSAESKPYRGLSANYEISADTINRGEINPLPGTKTEVENINKMLKQNNLQVKLYTVEKGNEESFKALSGKHQNILHIATHGFFWTDSTAQKREYFSQRMTSMDRDMPTPPSIDPLNRCGLLFAGAQLAWSGHSAELPEGVQDGILTAKEISLLDLRDADLVVLSACETGKGEITGDGVFGLQRAFKMAGAKTIIMSLWPVNDAATQLLMTEFYSNWITKHQSKREAFRNAQNAVRAKMEEPVYWAGFVMLD